MIPGNFYVVRNTDAPALLTEVELPHQPPTSRRSCARRPRATLEAEALYLGIARCFARRAPGLASFEALDAAGHADTVFTATPRLVAGIDGAFDAVTMRIDGERVPTVVTGGRIEWSGTPPLAGGVHDASLSARFAGEGASRARKLRFHVAKPPARIVLELSRFAARGHAQRVRGARAPAGPRRHGRAGQLRGPAHEYPERDVRPGGDHAARVGRRGVGLLPALAARERAGRGAGDARRPAPARERRRCRPPRRRSRVRTSARARASRSASPPTRHSRSAPPRGHAGSIATASWRWRPIRRRGRDSAARGLSRVWTRTRVAAALRGHRGRRAPGTSHRARPRGRRRRSRGQRARRHARVGAQPRRGARARRHARGRGRRGGDDARRRPRRQRAGAGAGLGSVPRRALPAHRPRRRAAGRRPLLQQRRRAGAGRSARHEPSLRSGSIRYVSPSPPSTRSPR